MFTLLQTAVDSTAQASSGLPSQSDLFNGLLSIIVGVLIPIVWRRSENKMQFLCTLPADAKRVVIMLIAGAASYLLQFLLVRYSSLHIDANGVYATLSGSLGLAIGAGNSAKEAKDQVKQVKEATGTFPSPRS